METNPHILNYASVESEPPKLPAKKSRRRTLLQTMATVTIAILVTNAINSLPRRAASRGPSGSSPLNAGAGNVTPNPNIFYFLPNRSTTPGAQPVISPDGTGAGWDFGKAATTQP